MRVGSGIVDAGGVAVLEGGKEGLLEVELALQRPHDLVVDLAGVAQPPQRGALGRHHLAPHPSVRHRGRRASIGVRLPGGEGPFGGDPAQRVQHALGQRDVGGEFVEAGEPRLGGALERVGALDRVLARAGRLDAEPADQPRQGEALGAEGADDDETLSACSPRWSSRRRSQAQIQSQSLAHHKSLLWAADGLAWLALRRRSAGIEIIEVP
jgi:hypothetical protein